MRGLRAAASFLTRIDAGADARAAADLASGIPWFPVVGGLIGFAQAGLYAAGQVLFPSFIAAVLCVAFVIWMTGAIHEDGLADTFDAFGTKRSREDTMRILKDPNLGTYGVVALVASVLLRVGALASFRTPAALAVLPAAHALSRTAAVVLVGQPMASENGLGASYAEVSTRGQITAAIPVGLAIAVVALGPLAAAAIAVSALASCLVQSVARRRIGGVSGDVIGTAQQLAEICVLLVALVALHRGWPSVPWWSSLR